MRGLEANEQEGGWCEGGGCSPPSEVSDVNRGVICAFYLKIAARGKNTKNNCFLHSMSAILSLHLMLN